MMIRLLNLFQRAGLLRSAPGPESPTTSPDETERIVRRIVERLSEDEALRGSLTGAGFAPVLGFVASLVSPAVERALPESSAAQAEQTVSHAARLLAREIASAAESGVTAGVVQALNSPIVPPDACDRARAVLPPVLPTSISEDGRAQLLAGILSQAISRPPE